MTTKLMIDEKTHTAMVGLLQSLSQSFWDMMKTTNPKLGKADRHHANMAAQRVSYLIREYMLELRDELTPTADAVTFDSGRPTEADLFSGAKFACLNMADPSEVSGFWGWSLLGPDVVSADNNESGAWCIFTHPAPNQEMMMYEFASVDDYYAADVTNSGWFKIGQDFGCLEGAHIYARRRDWANNLKGEYYD